MPENSEIHSTETCLKNFAKVNQVFETFGFSEAIKLTIFELLASILHLGNIEFEDNGDGHAKILEPSENNIKFASKLMKVPFNDLKTSILFKSMKDNNSEIL